MKLAVLLAVCLLALAAGATVARSATSLPCFAGQLRPTLKIKKVKGGFDVRVDVLNIGARCTFQTKGAILHGGATRLNALTKLGRAVQIPQNRTARLHVTWRNWCAAPGPAQFVLKIKGASREISLPFFPPPPCLDPGAKTAVTVGAPSLLKKS